MNEILAGPDDRLIAEMRKEKAILDRIKVAKEELLAAMSAAEDAGFYVYLESVQHVSPRKGSHPVIYVDVAKRIGS